MSLYIEEFEAVLAQIPKDVLEKAREEAKELVKQMRPPDLGTYIHPQLIVLIIVKNNLLK